MNFRKADLNRANLKGVDLHKSVLAEANLRGAQLGEADLKGVDLSGADLREVGLSDIKHWEEIDKIEGANLAEAENAPEGFLEWCKKNGALF